MTKGKACQIVLALSGAWTCFSRRVAAGWTFPCLLSCREKSSIRTLFIAICEKGKVDRDLFNLVQTKVDRD